MADDTEKLFVYGTLMPGRGNYRLIEQHVQNAQAATIEGVLVDLGAFPGLVPGDGRVQGMLLEIETEALKITDHIEGYSPGRQSNLYVRKEVPVELDAGGQVVAWTYEFSRPDGIAERPKLIDGHADGVPIHAWRGSTP